MARSPASKPYGSRVSRTTWDLESFDRTRTSRHLVGENSASLLQPLQTDRGSVSGGLPIMFRSVRRSVQALVAAAAILAIALPALAQTRPAAPVPGAANTGRITGRALEKGK